MATITFGNPMVVDATFGGAEPYNPPSVVFELEAPDETITSFTFGVDDEVTNPGTGVFECDFGLPTEISIYRWRAIGSDGSLVLETHYGTVFVIPSAVEPQVVTPPGPTLGPCFSWITGEDVALAAQFDYGSSPAAFDTAAFEASMALYEISGRRFAGLCQRTVRPCADACNCWGVGPYSMGFGPWYWMMGSVWGYGGAWAWYNEFGDHFGCNPMSKVRLAGQVREIVSVMLDDTEMPEYDPDTGFRNWRLDQYRWLVRMDTPGTMDSPILTRNFWPACQDMSLDPGQPGTFTIVYKWGVDPPELGRAAAVELAIQLYLALTPDDCIFPAGTVEIDRQGIKIERGLLANWFDPTKPTGLVNLDLFLKAYWKLKKGRLPAVFSPDIQSFARRVGDPGGS